MINSIVEDIMKERTKILRVCPICDKSELIRKDAVGKYCRSCRARENSRNKIGIDMTGQKLGKLTVVKLSHINKQYYWECICECGNTSIINGSRLRSGHTRSCGCLSKSRNGLSTSPTYRTWSAMIQRCYDSGVAHYQRYGARGIEVCDEWRNSFESFLSDMGERPEGLTLDRIDSSKGYTPQNCRWATPKEQSRGNSHLISAFGKEMSLIDWQHETGIRWTTLRKRIIDLKWDPEKALTKEVNKYATKKRQKPQDYQ